MNVVCPSNQFPIDRYYIDLNKIIDDEAANMGAKGIDRDTAIKLMADSLSMYVLMNAWPAGNA